MGKGNYYDFLRSLAWGKLGEWVGILLRSVLGLLEAAILGRSGLQYWEGNFLHGAIREALNSPSAKILVSLLQSVFKLVVQFHIQ
jgi:hypothetical protein